MSVQPPMGPDFVGPNYGSNQITLQPNAAPPQISPLQLRKGTVGIKSIIVYNSSSCPIALYRGMQGPMGGAVVVPPYTNTTINCQNTQYVFVEIRGTPTSAPDQYVDLQWSDQLAVALSTPTGTAPVATSSVPWSYEGQLQYTAAPSSFTLFASMISFNTGFYITDLILQGLDRQKIRWKIQTAIATIVRDVMNGMGDLSSSLSTPLLIAPGPQGGVSSSLSLLINPGAIAQGIPTPFTVYAAGYYV